MAGSGEVNIICLKNVRLCSFGDLPLSSNLCTVPSYNSSFQLVQTVQECYNKNSSHYYDRRMLQVHLNAVSSHVDVIIDVPKV